MVYRDSLRTATASWTPAPWLLLLCCLALAPGCATVGQPSLRGLQRTPPPQAPLAEVAKAYAGKCAGGQRESNNCAHFLSDAFIRAGYTELLSREDVSLRCKCGAGRVVRAQDMLKWFQEKSDRFHQGTPPPQSGMWAMYQEKPGRHHVLLYDADTGRYYGTDNCREWPIQWAYQW